MTLKAEEKICPLCGQDNECRHNHIDCWCSNIVIPKYIIEMIPEDRRGKACICKDCIERYKRD